MKNSFVTFWWIDVEWKLVSLLLLDVRLLLEIGVCVSAILIVILGVGDVRGRDLQLLGHLDLDVLGKQLRIGDLVRVRFVDGQELDLDSVEGIGEEVPDGEHVGVGLVEGPGDGVVVRVKSRIPVNVIELGLGFVK